MCGFTVVSQQCILCLIVLFGTFLCVTEGQMFVLGDAATLFTGTLNGQYGYPSGFCFECGDAPIRVGSIQINWLFHETRQLYLVEL